jgi:hypothetical protein
MRSMNRLQGQRDDIPASTRTLEQGPLWPFASDYIVDLARSYLFIAGRFLDDNDRREMRRDTGIKLPFLLLTLNGVGAE